MHKIWNNRLLVNLYIPLDVQTGHQLLFLFQALLFLPHIATTYIEIKNRLIKVVTSKKSFDSLVCLQGLKFLQHTLLTTYEILPS